MAIKKYHKSANIFTRNNETEGVYLSTSGNENPSTGWCASAYIRVNPNETYTFVPNSTGANNPKHVMFDINFNAVGYVGSGQQTFTTTDDTAYMRFSYRSSSSNMMLNSGSSPLPYEPYDPEVWHDIPYRKYSTETDAITTLPTTIIGDGTPITSYTIKGNLVQSGTPTPSSPIYPSECGERTENLFDATMSIISGKYIDVSGDLGSSAAWSVSDYFAIGENIQYTISPITTATSSSCHHAFYNASKELISTLDIATADNTQTFTTPQNTAYMRISFRSATVDINTIMLTAGSTAPSTYIPYGYKLPLTLGSTTTDIYLGEVQSTRRVKKLVLTGEEDWFIESQDNFYINNVITDAELAKTVVCSHQASIANVYVSRTENVWISGSGRLNFTTTTISHTAADFKAFLAQEYANGTPVTVWYVLAEPTTGIVNEPIRKIGDYVDSVSGTGLATSGTAQTFDIGTTLKPSEVDLTYHGWHEHEDTKYST